MGRKVQFVDETNLPEAYESNQGTSADTENTKIDKWSVTRMGRQCPVDKCEEWIAVENLETD